MAFLVRTRSGPFPFTARGQARGRHLATDVWGARPVPGRDAVHHGTLPLSLPFLSVPRPGQGPTRAHSGLTELRRFQEALVVFWKGGSS